MIYERNTLSSTYVLRELLAMKYMPATLHGRLVHRKLSTLMYVAEGQYHYEWNGGEVYAHSGDIIYVPQGSTYEYRVMERAECIQVEFSLEKDGEPVLFSEVPTVITPASTNRAYQLFDDLLTQFYQNDFSALSAMHAVLAMISAEMQSPHQRREAGRIEPALEYIKRHFTEKLYISELADMCTLSEAHLRRLFHRYTGMSPVQYKNHLLIMTAAGMLRTQSMSVSEVAAALHFPDLYTFSQLFKKKMGVSPKMYARLDLPAEAQHPLHESAQDSCL